MRRAILAGGAVIVAGVRAEMAIGNIEKLIHSQIERVLRLEIEDIRAFVL